MGWFGRSDQVSQEPHVIHTSERKQCWAARDQFFACLDSIDVVDAIKDDKKARASCSQELQAFEKACIASWVDYFKQKRVADIARKRRVEELEAKGYLPMDGNMVVTEVRGIK